ncbi:MAG: alpha/beta hydrolase [Candidatus Nitrotoga sp.]
MSILLPHITLDIGTSPQHSIIWLHGLGADGKDFVPIAHEIKLPVAVRYLFPHAPQQPVTINGGMMMRAWYDIIAFNGPIDSAGIQASQATIENLIAQEKQRGIVAKNIYLAGFSQGGAIALYTGLHHAEKLGGIIALSSRLPHAEELPEKISAHRPPIFMAHGRSDPIIPYSTGSHSATLLKEGGYQLEWREYDMPHSVCAAEIADIERWLIRQLSNNPA